MRVVNQAIDDIVAERKDKLKPCPTWQQIIDRGITAYEADMVNGGEIVPLLLEGRVYYVPVFVAKWAVGIIEKQNSVQEPIKAASNEHTE